MGNKFADIIKKIKINEKTVNLVLILVLGFLVGVAVKTEAKKRITIGFQDYLVKGMKQDFDLNAPTPQPAGQDQVAPDQNQPAAQDQNQAVPATPGDSTNQ